MTGDNFNYGTNSSKNRENDPFIRNQMSQS